MAFTELLPALPWLLPFAALARLVRRTPDLSDARPVTDRRLSMIIPARNEGTVIERCVRSILATTYPDLELIVVDDRSTDDTAAIVERIAREDRRVRLVRGEPLPEGWYGKPWACVQGYRAATGEVLCFTDADTTHEPALMPHAVGALVASGAELFTVMPTQLCITPAERLVLPQIFFLLGVRFDPARLNRARRPQDAIANGQFILMSRAAYEKVGTHAVVHGEVAEDLALAQEVLKRGGRLHMEYALDLMQTRMYTSWAHIKEGWSKNLYLGARRVFPPDQVIRRRIAPLFIAVPFLFWLLPPVALLLQVAGLDLGLLTPALAATLLSALFWMIVVAGMELPAVWGLGYPIGAAACVYIALRSTWRGARKVEWKGRTYGEGNATTNG